jgi:hypothetical protein
MKGLLESMRDKWEELGPHHNASIYGDTVEFCIAEPPESEGEKRRNRSEAMRGNQNARKYGMSVSEVNDAWKSGVLSITDVAGALREYFNEKSKNPPMGPLGPISMTSPRVDGLSMRTWEFAANTVKQLQNGDISVKEAESRFTDSESKKLKERAIAEGMNRSEAMQGNDNAAGHHNVDTAAEFNAKYNKHIAPEALPIWKATQWDGSINVDDLQNTRYLEKSGNYVKTADGRWYDIVNFASGNIYDKLDKLENTKDGLSKAEYGRQKAILEAALPPPKTVLEFEISPLSLFAEKFETGEVWTRGEALAALSDQKGKKRGKFRDDYHTANDMDGKNQTLTDAFKQWISKTSNDELALSSGITKTDVLNYVNKTRVVAARSKNEEEKEEIGRAHV